MGNKLARSVWQSSGYCFYTADPAAVSRRGAACCLGSSAPSSASRFTRIHPPAIWAPWNLEMGDHACLSEGVDCYCVAKIRIGAHSTISQYSFLVHGKP
jgi:putative colanic acid biosynthesis acetyltransferase WcaF